MTNSFKDLFIYHKFIFPLTYFILLIYSNYEVIFGNFIQHDDLNFYFPSEELPKNFFLSHAQSVYLYLFVRPLQGIFTNINLIIFNFFENFILIRLITVLSISFFLYKISLLFNKYNQIFVGFFLSILIILSPAIKLFINLIIAQPIFFGYLVSFLAGILFIEKQNLNIKIISLLLISLLFHQTAVFLFLVPTFAIIFYDDSFNYDKKKSLFINAFFALVISVSIYLLFYVVCKIIFGSLDYLQGAILSNPYQLGNLNIEYKSYGYLYLHLLDYYLFYLNTENLIYSRVYKSFLLFLPSFFLLKRVGFSFNISLLISLLTPFMLISPNILLFMFSGGLTISFRSVLSIEIYTLISLAIFLLKYKPSITLFVLSIFIVIFFNSSIKLHEANINSYKINENIVLSLHRVIDENKLDNLLIFDQSSLHAINIYDEFNMFITNFRLQLLRYSYLKNLDIDQAKNISIYFSSNIVNIKELCKDFYFNYTFKEIERRECNSL